MIALVVGQGSDNTALALSMGLAIAVFAALGVLILTRAQSRSGRAL